MQIIKLVPKKRKKIPRLFRLDFTFVKIRNKMPIIKVLLNEIPGVLENSDSNHCIFRYDFTDGLYILVNDAFGHKKFVTYLVSNGNGSNSKVIKIVSREIIGKKFVETLLKSLE